MAKRPRVKWTPEGKRLRAKLERAEKAHVKVGILANKGGNEKHDPESGATVAQIAAWNEYGTKTIPERPFIRSTFANREGDLEKVVARLAGHFVEGRVSLSRALDTLGAWGANAIRRTVTSGPGMRPPNSPATIKAKGSARPLVDTGRMLGAVSWEVVDAGTEGRGGYRK